MNATVKLFALARQLAAADSVTVALPSAATVADLREALARQVPALAELMPHALFAVNARYAANGDAIPPDADLACIPPVSGG